MASSRDTKKHTRAAPLDVDSFRCGVCPKGKLQPFTHAKRPLWQRPAFCCTDCEVLAYSCPLHLGIVTRVLLPPDSCGAYTGDCTCDPLRSFDHATTVWTSDGTYYTRNGKSFPDDEFVAEVKVELARHIAATEAQQPVPTKVQKPGSDDLYRLCLETILRLYEQTPPPKDSLDDAQRVFINRWTLLDVLPEHRPGLLAYTLLENLDSFDSQFLD